MNCDVIGFSAPPIGRGKSALNESSNVPRFQISIVDLLLFTISVAFAFAVYREGGKSLDAVWAFVVMQLCVSWLRDIRQWSTVHAFIGIVLAVGMLSHYVFLFLEYLGHGLDADDGRIYFGSFSQRCRDLALLVGLLMTMPSSGSSARRTGGLLVLLWMVGCGILLIWTAFHATQIAGLVNDALVAIDAAMMFQYDKGSSPSDYFVAQRRLFFGAILATALSAFNVWALNKSVQQSKRGAGRFGWLALFVGMALSCATTFWIYQSALPRFSPIMAEEMIWPRASRLFFGALSVLIGSAYLSLRLLEGSRDVDSVEVDVVAARPETRSRRPGEILAKTVLVIIATWGVLRNAFWFWFGDFQGFELSVTIFDVFIALVELLFFAPLLYALIAIAGWSIWQNIRHGRYARSRGVTIGLTSYLVTLVSVIAVLVTGGVALTWLGFAINVYPYRFFPVW